MKFRFQLSKRQKFFLAALGIIAGLVLIRSNMMMVLAWRFRILAFCIYSALITIISLRDEDFKGIEWLTLPILPITLAIGATLVYPLLPNEINYFLFWRTDVDTGFFIATLIRWIYLAGLFVGFYASLLSSNIYNIAALKTIQLIRAAHSVGFLLTLVAAFLSYIVIYSFHLGSSGNFLLILLVSFPLVLQSIWSINLEPYLGREVISYSLAVSLILAELAWVLSFWPVPEIVNAMVVTAAAYEGIGVIQYQMLGKLNKTIAKEFILISFIFIFVIFLTASWKG